MPHFVRWELQPPRTMPTSPENSALSHPISQLHLTKLEVAWLSNCGKRRIALGESSSRVTSQGHAVSLAQRRVGLTQWTARLPLLGSASIRPRLGGHRSRHVIKPLADCADACSFFCCAQAIFSSLPAPPCPDMPTTNALLLTPQIPFIR